MPNLYFYVLVGAMAFVAVVAKANNQCTDDFLEAYLARRNCVGGVTVPQNAGQDRDKIKADIESQACVQLGFLETLAAKKSGQIGAKSLAGAGAGLLVGGTAGKMFQALLAKQGPDATKKFNQLLDATAAEEAKRAEVLKMKTSIEDKATERISKGKYKKFEDLQKSVSSIDQFTSSPFAGHSLQDWEAAKAARPGETYKQTMARYDQESELLREIRAESMKKIEAEFQKSRGSNTYAYWAEAADDYAYTRTRQEKLTENDYPLTKKIREIFADEYKTIDKMSAGSGGAFLKNVINGSPEVRFAYAMKRNIGFHTFNKLGLPIGHGEPDSSLRYITDTAKDAKEAHFEDGVRLGKRRMVAARGLAKSAAIGGASGALIGLAAQTFAPMILDGNDLRACQSELKLSPSEIQYLGYGSIEVGKRDGSLNLPKIHSNAVCSSVSLNQPEKVIQDFKARAGIPDGLCQMMQNENARLVKMMGESPNAKLDCDEFSDANVKLNSRTKEMTFIQPGYTLKTQMLPKLNFPNFQVAQIRGADGKPDRKRQIDFANKLNNEYHPSQMQENIDVIQKSRGCEYNGAVNCELLNASVKSQIAMNLQRGLCASSTASRQVDPSSRSGIQGTK